jgi:hypothetical protein
MPRPLPILLLLAVLAAGGLAAGAAPARGQDFADDPLYGPKSDAETIYGEDYVIVVATIVGVGDPFSFRGLLVDIDVREVLKGPTRNGKQTIWWVPFSLELPKIGSRMILGGEAYAPGESWVCSELCCWPYSDSLCAAVKQRVRAWAPWAERRRRALAPGREEEQRRAWQARVAALARERDAETRWLVRERVIARSAPVERLVLSSSDVVLGIVTSDESDVVWGPPARWARLLQPVEWLRASILDTMSKKGSPIPLIMEVREDSLARRWNECPRDLGALSRHGEQVAAFLRYAHDPMPYFAPSVAYRVADPIYGLILCDSHLLQRVRAAAARCTARTTEPVPGCGAPLKEFTKLSDAEAAEVGLKFTPLAAFRLPVTPARSSLVLGCVASTESVSTGLSAGWFASCLLPDRLYSADYVGSWSLRVTPRQMSAILDSLTACLAVHPGSAEDSITVTLRHVRNGRERICEAMVSAEAFLAIVRALANLLPPEARPPRPLPRSGWSVPAASLIRSRVLLWARQVDPRCAAFEH